MYISDCVSIYCDEKTTESLLIDRKLRVKYSINHDAVELLRLIDQNPHSNINELSERFNLSSNNFNDIQKLGLMSNNIKFDTMPFRTIKKETFKHVTIECTTKCNLKCKHCCYMCGNLNGTDMEWHTLKNIIAESVRSGTQHLTITGGEPMLHPNFIEILELTDKLNIPTTLFSNLTNCSDEIIDCIDKYHIFRVTTSLESDDPKIHDEFRGKDGSHKKTTDAIKKLTSKNIPVNVNLVIGMHNYNKIDKTISFIKGLGANCKIDIISPFGRASKMNIDYDKIINEINKLNYRLKYDCGVCSDMIFISADGNVKMCPSIDDKRLIFSNISDLDPDFGEYKEKCLKLGLTNDRYPGCRARALQMSGDVTGKDPIYEKMVEHV